MRIFSFAYVVANLLHSYIVVCSPAIPGAWFLPTLLTIAVTNEGGGGGCDEVGDDE